jgi:RND family efflux transporter MFP subunit
MIRHRLLLAALGLLAACSAREKPAAAPAPAQTAATPPGAGSRLAEPQPVRHAPRTVVTGTLRARQQAPLAMSVPGTLLRIAVLRGQEVAAGALLLALDDAAAAATVRQAEAATAAARAQLAMAEDGLVRVTAIHGQQGSSELQLVQARAQRDLAAAQLAAAEAQTEQARVLLGHHQLHAPFAGVVTRVPEGVGLTVAPGVPLVTLAAVRSLTLDTAVTQEEAAALTVGARLTVVVPATGARSDQATVAVVVPVVDPGTNRVPVEIAVPNGDGRFHAGAFARAELPAAPPRDAWRIPSAALVQRDAGYAAWVAGPDGRARTLPVRLLGDEGPSSVVVPAEGGAWPAGLRAVEHPPVGIVEGTAVAEAAP